MKVGIFDSGLGGLTVFRTIVEAEPQYDYLYFGDTANVPYGDRSEEEIYELTRQAVEYLFQHEVLLAIIACNTASVESLRRLQDTMIKEAYPDRKILGVVIPTVEHVVTSRAKKVLLIGTRRTIESGKYERELQKYAADHVELFTCATPGIVPFIERGEVTLMCDALQGLVEDFIDGEGELVILGCTHYAVLIPELRRRYGRYVEIIAQDEIVPAKFTAYLEKHPEIASRLTTNGTRDYYVTGNTKTAEEYLDLFEKLLATES